MTHPTVTSADDEQLEASLKYQYLITLGDSQWGLLAEKLINNITLSKEDVKSMFEWRVDVKKVVLEELLS